jgi:hypothetical protein
MIDHRRHAFGHAVLLAAAVGVPDYDSLRDDPRFQALMAKLPP